MERNLPELTDTLFDVLVVGGGIHGAWVAWDAALRGLSVALIDRGDFGHANSANSLKTVHGGLRYLQDGDIRLVRQMIHERMTLLRVAPHLVHPLPCLMPTYPKLMKSRWVMAAALAVNDIFCMDRKLPDPQKRLPRGQILTRAETLDKLPGVADAGITGGALWHDAQMYNSERLTLSFIRAAVARGAAVANYVEATGFLGTSQQITGVRARDTLGNDAFEIRARLVINTAGPWVNRLLGFVNPPRRESGVPLSVAMNIVTRQLVADCAAGVPSWPRVHGQAPDPDKPSRLLFIAPWRNRSIIGTTHVHYQGSPDEYRVRASDVDEFLQEINSAYPGADLALEDVLHVHSGFLPAKAGQSGAVKLLRRGQVWDHSAEEGVEGLISVISVKYTSARHLAQQAVDVAVEKLGKTAAACQTHVTPVFGGQIERFDDFLTRALQARPGALSAESMRRLVYNYGTHYPAVLAHRHESASASPGDPVDPETALLRAEVRHAVREEMAQTLSDVVMRRTELGSAGWPGLEAVRICADVMAAELGWTPSRVQREIDQLQGTFAWTSEGTSAGRPEPESEPRVPQRLKWEHEPLTAQGHG